MSFAAVHLFLKHSSPMPSVSSEFAERSGRPWRIAMSWEDLLFMHWPVSASLLRPLLPKGLELDTFEGTAWIAVVPFRMRGTRLRGFSALPGVATFPELNVRTYVRHKNRAGVWFFSLDAGSSVAVLLARSLFHLPYFRATLHCTETGGQFLYRSQRWAVLNPGVRFEAYYRPLGEPQFASPGSLEHWLTERYALFSVNHSGQIFRGDIHHDRWPLQAAEVEIVHNNMTHPLGFDLPFAPQYVHFARHLQVVAWLIRPSV